MINRNMGCIEICEKRVFKRVGEGLIETWDVLKSYNFDEDRLRHWD